MAKSQQASSTVSKKSTLAKKSNKKVKLVSSKLAYDGPLFQVYTDYVKEPGGIEMRRDVIRHNGSIVILAVDNSKSKKDPFVVMERQYRHAANQYLWELPAGKLEKDENPLAGAKRELMEETGFKARRWSKHVRYYASPGFLGEWMQIYLAEELTAGEAHPEEDELIDFRLVKLSEVLQMIDEGKIMDGKTLIAIMLYARKLGIK